MPWPLCVCCLQPTHPDNLDPDTGLCIYCQPCPSCGGHDCDGDTCRVTGALIE
jgi:hypothetical protein